MNFKSMLFDKPKNENYTVKQLKDEAKNELESSKVGNTSNDTGSNKLPGVSR